MKPSVCVAAILLLGACSAAELPTDEAALAVQEEGFPDTDECTFLFPGPCQVNPDGEQRVCHQSVREDGWIRQNFGRVHCTTLELCDGGAGDIHGWRLCDPEGRRDILSPCGTLTGPNGCARCEVHPSCH